MSGPRWSSTVLRNPFDLAEHRGELSELFERVGSPWSPVAHPSWLAAWWRTRPTGNRVVCLVVRQQGEAVAAIPLEFQRVRMGGLRIRKATTTNLSWGWTSALIDPAADPPWAGHFAEWLVNDAPAWSAIEMGSFPSGAAALEHIQEHFTGRGWDVHTFNRDMAHREPPPAQGEMTKRDRHKLRRHSSDPRCRGLRVQHHRSPDYTTLIKVLDEVGRHSWQGRSELSVYRREPDLYRELSRDPANPLDLTYLVDESGSAVAYVLCYAAGRARHAVDTAYDQRLAECSPGWMAWQHSMDAASAHGVLRYDFGEASPYKVNHLRATTAPGTQLVVTRGATRAWNHVTRPVRTRWNGRADIGQRLA